MKRMKWGETNDRIIQCRLALYVKHMHAHTHTRARARRAHESEGANKTEYYYRGLSPHLTAHAQKRNVSETLAHCPLK
jgi:hypothetical protein